MGTSDDELIQELLEVLRQVREQLAKEKMTREEYWFLLGLVRDTIRKAEERRRK